VWLLAEGPLQLAPRTDRFVGFAVLLLATGWLFGKAAGMSSESVPEMGGQFGGVRERRQAGGAVRSDLRVTATRGRVIRESPLRIVAMANGTVDFFNDTGGYGFIETEDADEDVFFHMEDVGGPDLEEGQEVEFEIDDAPKGPRATNVARQ
jgi:CspA family cold shock protein